MKVIVFGTGQSSEEVIKWIKNDIDIIGFCDNNIKLIGKKLKGKSIYGIDDINKIEWDYIVIASQYEEDIYMQLTRLGYDKDKILMFWMYSIQNNNYINNRLKLFNENRKEIEVIATGISYTYKGLSDKYLKRKSLSFAYGSQDIFYGYKIAMEILKNKNSVKYCIIGCCYYDFHFDLSLSSIKAKTLEYYQALGELHNYGDCNCLLNHLHANKKLGDEIFISSKEYYSKEGIYKENIENKEGFKLSGQMQAEIDCKKNYPNTVKENIKIFKKYLELLKDNDIKPIIVVFPASKCYTNYFSQRIESEFHDIINKIEQEYDFQYIDYFRSDLFNDDDFYDVSHLNNKGAEKFTKMLNNIIEW